MLYVNHISISLEKLVKLVMNIKQFIILFSIFEYILNFQIKDLIFLN